MAEVSKIGNLWEVGCCESRMAERSHWWNERWLMSPLFFSLSLSFSDYLPTYLSIYLFIYLSTYLSIHWSIDLSIYWSIDLSSNYRSIDVSLYRSIYRSIYLPLSLSVCLSICKLANEAILRNFLQKWKVECRADGLIPLRFAIFHSTCLK